MRRRPPADAKRPGLVIGPTTADADVQLERPTLAAGRRSGAQADRRIASGIRRRFRAHGHPGLGEIVVTVATGIVQLDGVVGDRTTRRVAEQIADAVNGVRTVENRLTIGTTPGRRPRRTA